MPEQKWYQLVLLEYKTQYFPEVLLAEMMEKYGENEPAHGIEKLKEISEIYIDYGGMCQVGMADMEFELPGCKLTIPARDVEVLFTQLNKSKIREDFSIPYYKYLSHWTGILLLPSQREQLIPLVKVKLEEAKEIGEKEWKHIRDSVDRVNEKAGRIVALPPARALRKENIH